MTWFAALFVSGIDLGICGGVAAFVWRKDGLTAARLWLAGSDLAGHPARYVRPDRVAVVRAVSVAGVGLILAAVVVLLAVNLRHLR